MNVEKLNEELEEWKLNNLVKFVFIVGLLYGSLTMALSGFFGILGIVIGISSILIIFRNKELTYKKKNGRKKLKWTTKTN